MTGLLVAHIAAFAASDLSAHDAAAPWHLTVNARAIVAALVASLGSDYRRLGEGAVHASARVEEGAVLKGPVLVGPGCLLGAGCYLRDGCWLDADCVVGPGCELKSSFLFRGTRLAHFNFVGDSVVGGDVNLEAGAILANHRNERPDAPLVIRHEGRRLATGVTKFGALVGDRTRIGANAVVAPGAIIARGSVLPRLSLTDQDAWGEAGT